jgi:hypothetical protein
MALVLVAAGAVFAEDTMMSAPPKDQGAMMSQDADQPAGTMMAPPKDAGDTMMAPAKDSGTMMAGRTVAFTDLKSVEALAAKGPTVLLFAAKGDTVSQADIAQINSEGERLGNITVVVVDPDKAADLKARYRVMGGHTYVRIDAMGVRLASWSGGGVDGILAHVPKM